MGTHGWGTKVDINPPQTDIQCPNCEEKMDLIFGFGIIHSGGNHFVAECPKCKTKTDFSDNNLWLKCRCLGLEILKNIHSSEADLKRYPVIIPLM